MCWILLVLFENELGVLFCVIGFFFQCGYNIESLIVVLIDDLILLCMIIQIVGDEKVFEQIEK